MNALNEFEPVTSITLWPLHHYTHPLLNCKVYLTIRSLLIWISVRPFCITLVFFFQSMHVFLMLLQFKNVNRISWGELTCSQMYCATHFIIVFNWRCRPANLFKPQQINVLFKALVKLKAIKLKKLTLMIMCGDTECIKHLP